MSVDKEATNEVITKEISPGEKYKNDANDYFKSMNFH